jgi:hypothetical protein
MSDDIQRGDIDIGGRTKRETGFNHKLFDEPTEDQGQEPGPEPELEPEPDREEGITFQDKEIDDARRGNKIKPLKRLTVDDVNLSLKQKRIKMFGTHANNFFSKEITTEAEDKLNRELLNFEDGEINRIRMERDANIKQAAQTEPETIEEELDPLALDRVTTERNQIIQAIANSKDGLISDDMKQQIEKLSVDHPKEFLKIFFPDEAN